MTSPSPRSRIRHALTPALLAALLAASAATAIEPLPIKPPALSWGDSIAVVAPAGVLDRQRIELARSRLVGMGFKVRIPATLFRSRGYLAGEDSERADELMAAFADPEVNAIFCGTGGYGTTRILDRLDYDVIRRNPKILTGFSDITGLHLAIQRKAGLVTFHTPLLMYGLGSPEGMTEFSAEYFWRAILYPNYTDARGELLPPGYAYVPPPDAAPLGVLGNGVARGRLTGGNLSLICALMGTPYEIQTEGRILFIEDRGEEPYRIDRYLSQLRLAGKLDRLAGAIIGMFTETGTASARGLSVEQVLRDYFGELHIPVVTGFPVGHFRLNASLPMSTLCEVDANTRRVRLLENPVELGEPDVTNATPPAVP